MKRIGIIYWTKGDGVATLHSRIVRNLGYEPVDFSFDQKLPESLKAILLYGPWGSMVPLANQLRTLPADCRPRLAWWLTEQLPNPNLPEWLRYWGGFLRNQIDRIAYRQSHDGTWKLRGRFGKLLTSKALRFRYYGDLYWLRRQGMLTLIVQGSTWSNRFLTNRGFRVFAPDSPSYYPEWGADLGLERDIPVLWIGKVATKRRRRLLHQVQKELDRHGVEILRIDGEKNPYVFGDERTILLNRSKIVINLLRAKWDNNAMRFHMAALNRALIVTEPMLNHTPFQPSVHLVEAKIEEMPDQILHYLNHEDERRAIAEQAYKLMTRYKREDVIAQILQETLR